MSPTLPPTTTLPQWLRQRARRWPEAPALVDGLCGSRYSHAALDHLVGRCAAGLAALGFGPGDVLWMVAPDAPEWPIAALAALAAGGAVGAADPACGATQLGRQLHALGARHAFTTAAQLALVRQAAAGAGPLQLIVAGEAEGTLSFTTLLACADAEPRPAASLHSLALLGAGRGLRLTHGAVLGRILACACARPLGRGDVTLSLRPMGRISGFVQGTLAPLAQGAAVVTLPRCEPALVTQARARHQVTRLLLAPP